MTILHSCIDSDSLSQNGTTYLHIKKSDAATRAYPADDALDNKIGTLRVLAFDPTLGTCRSNKLYNAEPDETIRHEIEPGIYDFVFLANEPNDLSAGLDAITRYSELASISYTASVINSADVIPMSQEIKSVEVLANSKGAKILNNTPPYAQDTSYDPLVLHLSRLAARVDITLESEEDLSDKFKGITFSNIPAGVPLLSSENGSSERNVTRTFDLAGNSGLFDLTVTDQQKERGIVWACKVTRRFIFPFNNFSPKNDKEKAIVFTVDMENRHSPSCELKIVTGQSDAESNYTLPRDAALLVIGQIKIPSIELNVQVKDWEPVGADWQIQDGWLNISQVEANITDFNGARITFSSNMPVVKILSKVYVGASGYSNIMETNSVFNDLAVEADGQTHTTRFSYKYDEWTKTGNGYMDVILDEYNIPLGGYDGIQKETFRLVLSAENKTGGKLQREIKINTEQHGYRVNYFDRTAAGYSGVFFRHNEMGERVIIGQVQRITWPTTFDNSTGKVNLAIGDIGAWKVYIEKGDDFLILSTTPSFDPAIGTDNPGNPESYPVKTNEYKATEYGGYEERGTYIEGRGRIYFRVGTKGTLSSAGAAPRYGVIRLEYTTGYRVEYNHSLYVRQGEAADYVMEGPGTVKFSPYNLTAQEYLDNPNGGPQWYFQNHPKLAVKGGEFVKYPTQAGAFFQWYLPSNDGNSNDYTDRWRRAYHPRNPGNLNNWPDKTGFMEYTPIWGSKPDPVPEENPYPKGVSYKYNIKNDFELCPDGWRYPTDGLTDRLIFNGPYPNVFSKDLNAYIHRDPRNQTPLLPDVGAGNKPPYDYSFQTADSEIRQSLFHTPIGGTTTSMPEEFKDETGGVTGELVVFNTLGRPSDKYYTNIADFLKFEDNNFEDIVLNNNISSQIGAYADGFYDRRPTRTIAPWETPIRQTYAVSEYNAEVAYSGVVIFNSKTMASTFFPMAGRRSPTNGSLMECGDRGYYWTSTAGPMSLGFPISAWYMSIGWHPAPGPGYTMPTYAQSVRCVKDE